jgi:hypothetical protein
MPWLISDRAGTAARYPGVTGPPIERARLGDDKNIASGGARVLRELPEVTGPESELRRATVH